MYGNAKDEELNKALDQYQKSLEIGDKKGIASAYNQVGSIYQNPDFKKCSLNTALEYYEKSLEISLEIRDKKGVAQACVLIGTIYLDNYFFAPNKIETALSYFEKGLEISLEIEAKEVIAQAYHHLGAVYQQKKEYKTALIHYFQAYVSIRPQETKGNIIVLQRELGRDTFLESAGQALTELSQELQEQINLDVFLELPRASVKTYKRNDKVKVRYQNGIEKEGK